MRARSFWAVLVRRTCKVFLEGFFQRKGLARLRLFYGLLRGLTEPRMIRKKEILQFFFD